MGNAATKELGAGSSGARGSGSGPYNSDHGSRSSPDRNSPPQRAGGHSTRGSSHQHSSRSRDRRQHSRHHRKSEGYQMITDPNESVDGGFLFPQGVYQGPQDFKVSVVREVIIQRRLCPFYKGLDSVEPEWTDQELLEHVSPPQAANSPKPGQPGPPSPTQQIWLYRNVHECPICFLVYPRLNSTRCCGQDICTECFVQIKRNPPHPPYTSMENTEAEDVLEFVSEPCACPYCAQPDLGVTFEAPPFEWGIPSSVAATADTSTAVPDVHHRPSGEASTSAIKMNGQRQRRTSIPVSHPSVVTVDMIRPDWEEKLASARRRLARKSAAARVLHRSALLPNTDSNGDGADSPSSGATEASGGANSNNSGRDSPGRDSPGLSSPNRRDRSRSSPHRGTPSRNGSEERDIYRHRRGSSLADLVEATRSMTVAQSRALEQRMIEEAIKESLAQT